MDDASKMDITELPPKEDLFNFKNNTHIMDEEYEHAKTVWKFFGCRSLKDYHKLYLVVDVLMLPDVFEEFRRMCREKFISLPSMPWDAMLLKTNVKLELIQEEQAEIYYKVEQNICGGISSVMKRHAVADGKHSLIFLNANN